MPGGVFRALAPCPLHGISEDESIASIERIFKNDAEPHDIAAIIIEPVQGEGGFYQAQPELMQGLRAICDKYGILLIADEVQTGFARTGQMFASEDEGIVPDMMTLAKGIAGGLPLAAVVGKQEIMDAPHVGGLGGTYGGNPIATAAALGAMKAYDEGNLLERAHEIGAILQSELTAMKSRDPRVGDVRGRGAMMAIELIDADGKPDAALTQRVAKYCHAQGVIVLTCGTDGNVIRLLPPLSISDELLREGIRVIGEALEAN